MTEIFPQNDLARLRSHTVEFVRISLDQDGDTGVFERHDRPKLIPEVGQAEDYAVVFAAVLAEEIGVAFGFCAFRPRRNAASSASIKTSWPAERSTRAGPGGPGLSGGWKEATVSVE
jgi:hypothetical protein